MAKLKKELYNDIWYFYKRNLGKTADTEWEIINRESHELLQNFSGDLFAKDLLYAIMNELGRK